MNKQPKPLQGAPSATNEAVDDQAHASKAAADAKPEEKKDDKKKPHGLTWERTIEIVKVCATVWVAMIGTICTMQYNERQHELNRIEAIAKVLPHLSSDTQADGSDANEMARDGAIWAAFRIANNKVMLRDLAALYPEDIYRVVSSIAAADGLEHDNDALTALEVASEKLASKYANNPKKQQLSVRLLEQSMRIRQHLQGDKTALNIVDLSTVNDYPSSPEQTADVMHALNKLGRMHLTNSQKGETVGTDRSRGRQLFVRARQIGIAAKDRTPGVMGELVEADQNLAELLRSENKIADAEAYEKEARDLASNKAVDTLTKLQLQHVEQKMSEVDKDGDGKVNLQEMKLGVKEGVISNDEFQEWQAKTANPGGAVRPVTNISIDKPTVVPDSK
jgi:hypothetical protein